MNKRKHIDFYSINCVGGRSNDWDKVPNMTPEIKEALNTIGFSGKVIFNGKKYRDRALLLTETFPNNVYGLQVTLNSDWTSNCFLAVIEVQEVDSIQNQTERETQEKAIKGLFEIAYLELEDEIKEVEAFNALSKKYQICPSSSMYVYSLVLVENNTKTVLIEEDRLSNIADYLTEEYQTIYDAVLENPMSDEEYDMEM